METPEGRNPEILMDNGSIEPSIERRARRTRSLRRTVLNTIDVGATFINRMPFVGKIVTKTLTLSAAAERDIYTKELRLVGAFGGIGYLMHANIGIGGRALEVTQRLVDNQYDPDNPLFWARLGFDITYTAGHYAAALAQVRLVTRLIPHLVRNTRHIFNESSRWRQHCSLEDDAERLVSDIKNNDFNRLRAFELFKSSAKKQSVLEQAFASLSDEDPEHNPIQYYVQGRSSSRRDELGRILLGTLSRPKNLRPIFGAKEMTGIFGFNIAVTSAYSFLKSL